MNKSKKRIIISIGIAILMLAIFGIILFSANLTANTPEKLLSLGEKYLSELNYEQALLQFLKVIEIDPMNPRGYTGAAEAYIGLGQMDKAIDILQRGFEHTGDEGIRIMLDGLSASQSEADALEVSAETPELLSAEQMAFLEPLEKAILDMNYETAFRLQTSPEYLDIGKNISVRYEEVIYKVDGSDEWYIKNIGEDSMVLEIGVWRNDRKDGKHFHSFFDSDAVPLSILITSAEYADSKANGSYKRIYYAPEYSEYMMESGTALDGLKHGEEIVETNLLIASPYSPVTLSLGDDTLWLSVYDNGKYVVFTGAEEMFYLQEQPFEDGSVGYPVCVDLATRGQEGAGYLNERNLDTICEIW